MAFKCKCCGSDFPDTDLITCFVCKSTFNTVCVNVSEKDSRVLRSRKNYKWTCSTCCALDVPGQVQTLMAIVQSLEKQLADIKTMLSAPPIQDKVDTYTIDDVMHEVEERRSKEGNFVLFNLKESDSDVHDNDRVMDILNHLEVGAGVATQSMKIYRMGRSRVEGRNRPVKVVLGSVEGVRGILRKSAKLKTYTRDGSSKVFLSRDLTVRQIDAKRKVIAEYHRRKDNGEEVYLKYSDGVPKIVPKKNFQQSNSQN